MRVREKCAARPETEREVMRPRPARRENRRELARREDPGDIAIVWEGNLNFICVAGQEFNNKCSVWYSSEGSGRSFIEGQHIFKRQVSDRGDHTWKVADRRCNKVARAFAKSLELLRAPLSTWI